VAKASLRRTWGGSLKIFLMLGVVPTGPSMSPHALPPLPGAPRFEHQAVWDPVKEKVYVFGGLARDANGWLFLLNELWSLDPAAGTWVQLAAEPGPSARTGCAVAWDPVRRQVLVSGGETAAAGCDHDLWGYIVDDSTWTERAPEPYAPFVARRYHSLTYDPSRDRFWQMSGHCIDEPYRHYSGYDALSDVWSPLQSIRGAYGYRIKHGAVWDSERSRLLVYGGELPAYAPAQSQLLFWQTVWSVDPGLSTWTQLPAPTLPNRRSSFISGYDPYLDALLIYGGLDLASIPDPNPTVSGALWAYRLRTADWVRLDREDLPHRMRAAGVYSAGRGEIFAFGGLSEYSRYPGDAQSESFAIPVELPATFRWLNGDRGNDDDARRSGILHLPVETSALEQVRLFDSITGKPVAESMMLRRLGRSRWLVKFGPATEAESQVRALDRLVISGLMAGQTRAFLSPVHAKSQSDADSEADLLVDDAVKVSGPEVICRRDAEDWLLTVRGTQQAPESIVIADVRGRVWARLSDLSAESGYGHTYRWRVAGVVPPSGLYFVRVTAAGQVGTTKLFLR